MLLLICVFVSIIVLLILSPRKSRQVGLDVTRIAQTVVV